MHKPVGLRSGKDRAKEFPPAMGGKPHPCGKLPVPPPQFALQPCFKSLWKACYDAINGRLILEAERGNNFLKESSLVKRKRRVAREG